jgi:hypothetical protein
MALYIDPEVQIVVSCAFDYLFGVIGKDVSINFHNFLHVKVVKTIMNINWPCIDPCEFHRDYDFYGCYSSCYTREENDCPCIALAKYHM